MRMLVLADVIGLATSFAIAELLLGGGASGKISTGTEFLFFLATLPAWIAAARLYGLYGRDEKRLRHTTTDDFVRVFHLVTVGIWALSLLAWGTGLGSPRVAKVVTFWVLALVLIVIGRVVARAICRTRPAYLQRTVIVGAGHVGQLVARKLAHHPEYGLDLLGFVDAEPKQSAGSLERAPLLGSPDSLADIVADLDVERVIIAFSTEPSERTVEVIRTLRSAGVQIDVVPRLFDIVAPNADLHTIEGLPLMMVSPAQMSRVSRIAKRGLDLVVAAALIVLTAPLLAVIAWRIKQSSPGPILFRQTRLGMNMREFTALKFRSMTDGADDVPHREFIEEMMRAGNGVATQGARGNGLFKLERETAVTPVGRWLRRTSLDELPQLFNVIRGDMSLVGPRPCIPYEVEHFASHHYERFLVPAGLTGYWQITARAHVPFNEALDLDVAYARGWSLGLDLRLLCRTPLEILRARRTA
jgi:exopolysaccharide biosynthesis polyprenyl glycosylphosphotransferase